MEPIMTLDKVKNFPGLLQYEARTISPNAFTEATFTGLRAVTDYVVFVAVDNTDATPMKYPGEEEDNRPVVKLLVTSLPESLELDWDRMTDEMRTIEVRAALRCKWLYGAAAAHYPVIVLPTDSDIEFGPAITPSAVATGSLEDGSATTTSTLPPTAAATVAAAAVATTKGSTGKSPNRRGAGSTGSGRFRSWQLFLDWWVGPSTQHTVTKVRAEFQLREALFAAQQPRILTKYSESGLRVTDAEIESLKQFAANGMATLAAQQGKAKKDPLPSSPELTKFRSWYKGGQIMRDLIEASVNNKR